MKRLFTTSILTAALYALSQTAGAADLMQVFQDALQNDQDYKQAQATFLDNKEVLAQARAAVLPTIGLQGGYGFGKNQLVTSVPLAANTNTTSQNLSYGLTITQAIFNWSAFDSIKAASYSVKSAVATFSSAQQTLVLNIANQYFAVLEAQEKLRYVEAQERSLLSQLNVAKQRYQVGLDPITSVYQAKAQYDASKAQYIADENALSNSFEQLRVMSGSLYTHLADLKDDFPLVKPNPTDINQWTNTAVKQNLDLKTARFAALAAEETIHANSAARAPTVGLTGQYGLTQTKYLSGTNSGTQNAYAGTVGVEVNFQPYQGGLVESNVRKAEADYQLATAKMDLAYRNTIATTRQSYLGVIAGISQIVADRQAIKSAQEALNSTQAGYKVGTQTINDVLDAQQQLFQAENQYVQDRFAYLTTTLQLKQATGTLSPKDLMEINNWLSYTTMTTRPEEDSIGISATTTIVPPATTTATAPVVKPMASKAKPKARAPLKTTAKKASNQVVKKTTATSTPKPASQTTTNTQ